MAINFVNLADIDAKIQNARANEQAYQTNEMQNRRIQELYNDEQVTKRAYEGAINPDGTLNKETLFKNLGTANPMQAYKIRNEVNAQELANQKADRENKSSIIEQQKKLAEYGRDRLAKVVDQPTYEAAINELVGLGAQHLKEAPPDYMNGGKDFVLHNMKTADQFIMENLMKDEPTNPQEPSLTPNSPQSATTPAAPLPYSQKKVDMLFNSGIKEAVQSAERMQKANERVQDDWNKYNRVDANTAATIGNSQANNATNFGFKERELGLKADENAIKRGEKIPENSTALRKEFDDLPEVKNYKLAKTAFKSIEDAKDRNTTASDINIVYGIAKLYDPTSVVREGEYATVANSPNIPERIKGLAQYLGNGGKLTPKVKQDIYNEAQSRITAYENEYLPQRQNYEDIAKRSNADPSLIFPSEFKSAIKPKNKPKAPVTPATKVINGVSYHKINGKWMQE